VCDIEISYTRKRTLNEANKNNTVCKSCRSRRYPIESEYVRKCPQCLSDIKYKNRQSRDTADNRNTSCSKCRLKWHETKFGTKKYNTFKSICKLCGSTKTHYTKHKLSDVQLKTHILNANKKMCRSCAMKTRCLEKPSMYNTAPELELKLILNELNIDYIFQYRVDNKYYDFYIPETNTLVEVDGIYWHGKDKLDTELDAAQIRTRKNDKIKNELAKRLGFNLIRIWSDELTIETVKNKCLI